MAQLQEVLGSILEGVLQARAISDAYSAELAKKYSSDRLLKHFPIPKIEIQNMRINLKFAINEMDAEGKMDIFVTNHELENIPAERISETEFSLSISNHFVSTTQTGEETNYQFTEK